MAINKDLVEALLMLSAIILVLIGTSEFSNETTKSILMFSLGGFSILMFILRVISTKDNKKEIVEEEIF